MKASIMTLWRLCQCIDRHDLSADKIIARFHVADLNELSEEQVIRIINKVERIAELNDMTSYEEDRD